MRLRHRVIPYIHSFNFASPRADVPLIQPVYWEYSSRDEAFRHRNQYYFGSKLIIVPMVSPRNTKTNHAEARAWIPPGRHVDLFSGTVYDGDRKLGLFRRLEYPAALARQGSIITFDANWTPGNACHTPPSL